jgi:hypothetical protein
MAGTDDVDKIGTWMILLALMLHKSVTLSPKELRQNLLGMKYNSNYDAFTRMIFGNVGASYLALDYTKMDQVVSCAKAFMIPSHKDNK